MKPVLNTGLAVVVLAMTLSLGTAQGGEAPNFIQDTFPAQGIDSAWENYQSIFFANDTVLDDKTKELMALSVSAQIPCDYCVYYHTRAAQAHGATEAEIKESLAVAALIRKWSTILNGAQYDSDQWQSEVDAMFSGN